MCKSVELGKHIVKLCIKDNYDISPSKIQKLLYYMQSLYLYKYNKKLFDENIIAWNCGPAIKEVNTYFTKFLSENHDDEIIANLFLLDEEMDVFKYVYEEKAFLTTEHLIEMTQNEKPWMLTYDDGKGQNCIISVELLKGLFGGQ